MAETPAEKARIIPHTQEAALLLEAVDVLRVMQADLAAIRAQLAGAPVSVPQQVTVKAKRVRAPRKPKEAQS